MKTVVKTSVLLASAAFLIVPAFAQVTQTSPATAPEVGKAEGAPKAQTLPDHAKGTPDFAKLDADASGGLTLAEVQVVDAKLTQADFDKYDADKSKSISKAEFAKWADAKHADHKPKG